jgi:predicted RNA-binding Zn ribbon-like protein
VREIHHDFAGHDLVSGHAAIDLVNTVTARDTEPSDWLASYEALVDWARHTSLFPRSDLAALEGLARKEPAEASAALMRCKLLREALCRVFYAFVHGEVPKRSDLVEIEKVSAHAAAAAKLSVKDGLARSVWSVKESGLDLIGHVITAQALRLLEDDRLERLRLCGGDHCGWLFLDLSKNSSRRWCDMATCGNVAKARRFQKRQRGAKKHR